MKWLVIKRTALQNQTLSYSCYPLNRPSNKGFLEIISPRKNQSVVISALPLGGTNPLVYFGSIGGFAITNSNGTAEFSLTTA